MTEIKRGRVSFTAWDLGGQDKIRVLWRYYYENAECIVYVVDSADYERLDLCADELAGVLGSE